VPTSVIVGKSLAEGIVEIRDRASGNTCKVSAADAVEAILAELGKNPAH
jgi:prolyl-tRNA synthetase